MLGISETESVFTPEDIVAYKQYPNSTDVMYIVQYRTREAAEKAWQMVYHSKESIWARGERINQLNFLWLDNKILQNEMSFSFDQSQDYPAMIDDPVFNEVTILADLQQKWGLDVVKVNLFFMAQGELNGAGLITFDNTIDAEIHVIQLFGGNFSDFQMETCGRLIKCQMKLLDKDKSGGAKSKRMISGIEQIIGDHFQRLEQQQGKQLRTQAKENDYK
ncbi:MAG: hypothetical protein EZS28_025305 [Streblomastix strix]|uniref:Uncharacterized protein n=1 Tax=Streblomastix strix TaxID=222440 RepID=A0A5J4V9T1_9EUKA|nr:MAG: hypothetical protein EZS28_025305 [Streblomastix strix]